MERATAIRPNELAWWQIASAYKISSAFLLWLLALEAAPLLLYPWVLFFAAIALGSPSIVNPPVAAFARCVICLSLGYPLTYFLCLSIARSKLKREQRDAALLICLVPLAHLGTLVALVNLWVLLSATTQ